MAVKSDAGAATAGSVEGDGVLVVLTTAADGEAADVMAKSLVEERLAGCVSRTPVGSTYRWEGSVVSEPEVLMVIKTTAGRWPELERRIRELHTYQTPEIVALGAEEVESHYLSWLIDAVADEEPN
ncbi:MAG TPA: divalent-cation tolerance protein CutA [Candidatus Limnocylindrales bacterium]|nr:divalent-cation tolerance protein CutA [Candidatus Limnocylindrales bacterium]